MKRNESASEQQAMDNRPLVSVAMITYNHRPFIAQAIDSVLAQRRDFPIEIVVSDDCSPDGTALVIDGYQACYPNLFVRRDPSQNVGMHSNFSRVWEVCRGKYIAMLEGDDWWHDSGKLETQVAFMEANPECTVCGHLVRLVESTDGQDRVVSSPQQKHPAVLDVHRLVAANYLPTVSVMCRAGVISQIPQWIRTLRMGDWPMWLLHACQGKVGFINVSMATYRLHAGGVWSSKPAKVQQEEACLALVAIQPHVPKGLQIEIDRQLAKAYFALFNTERLDKSYWRCRRQLLRYAHYSWRCRELSLKTIFRTALMLVYPRYKESILYRSISDA